MMLHFRKGLIELMPRFSPRPPKASVFKDRNPHERFAPWRWSCWCGDYGHRAEWADAWLELQAHGQLGYHLALPREAFWPK